MKNVEKLRDAWKKEGGTAAGISLIQALTDEPHTRSEAREVCFHVLQKEPANRHCRLLLARLFYLDQLFEFSLRELVELKRRGLGGSLDKLLAAFGPQAKEYLDLLPVGQTGVSNSSSTETPTPENAVVAEVDIDTDFLDVLEEAVKSEKGK